MRIRKYVPDDCPELLRLFYETVHAVNAKDYTEVQLNAWASGNENEARWNAVLMKNYSVVAEQDGKIVGFGDIGADAFLDKLYVHKDFQRRGIATAICDELERRFSNGRIFVHASITARPFFEKRNYKVRRERRVSRLGVVLTNFLMEKSC